MTLPKFYQRKPSTRKPPLNRKNGYGTGLVIRPGPLPEWAKALVPKRSPSLSLPLLDPLKRFGVRRRYAKPSAMPQIRVLGGDPIVPLFRQPEPPAPPPPSPDDPLDAGTSIAGLTRSGGRWTICRSKPNAWRAGRPGAMRDGCGRGVKCGSGVRWANHMWKAPPLRLGLRPRHLSPISWGRGKPKLERG